MKKKIIIISSSRADYGILNPLIQNLKKSCNLKTIITGSHLSNERKTRFNCNSW